MNRKLKVYAFFFATFLSGVFVGGSTVDLLDQAEQIELIFPQPAPAAVKDDLLQAHFNWGTSPDTSTMPIFGQGTFYVEALPGTTLEEKVITRNGAVTYDIYAMRKEQNGTDYDFRGNGFITSPDPSGKQPK